MTIRIQALQIRRGDVYTHGSTRYAAFDDARPRILGFDTRRAEPTVVDIAGHAYAGIVTPGTTWDLGVKMCGVVSVLADAEVELHGRIEVHHCTDDVSTAHPNAFNSRNRVAHLTRQRAMAHRRADDLDIGRDLAIRQAISDGVSVNELAEITGLTNKRIYQIRDSTR